MYCLVYISSATKLLTQDELLALLAECHEYNEVNGITGMLLYKEGNFMQAIEGEEQEVLRLFEKISKDPRHTGIISLVQGQQDKREFPGWSMGFRSLDDDDLSDIPSYSEFLDTPLTAAEFSKDPSRCKKLLLTFKKTM